jgi:hypothetical protein
MRSMMLEGSGMKKKVWDTQREVAVVQGLSAHGEAVAEIRNHRSKLSWESMKR